MAESVGMNMEEVFKLIAQMKADDRENMLAFAAELKKPTAIEQAKLDKEEAKVKAQQEGRLKMAQQEEQRKANLMRGCRHATYNPATGVEKHAWRAQVHAPDGEKPYFVPTCLICQTQLPKILANTEMLTQGVNLDSYIGLDVDRLRAWAQERAA